MKEIEKNIKEVGLLPLVSLDDLDKARKLARIMVEEQVPIMEVALRTNQALEIIKMISQEFPTIILGAGTVHTVEEAKKALENGAEFIVSPGINEDLISYCLEEEVPIYPGVATASEVERVRSFGLKTCKFFPAQASGGAKMLGQLKGPFEDMTFIPTGGISSDNMLDYLSLDNVLAIGGSFLCASDQVNKEDWDQVRKDIKEVIKKQYGFELLHLGLNSKDDEEAKKSVEILSFLFDKDVFENKASYFVGDIFEVMKFDFLGDHGHVAIATNDITRAISYCERKGFDFDYETKAYAEDKLIAIYFKEQIAGWAFHLRSK